MNLYLEQVRLEVCTHRGTSDADAQRWEWVEARDVARRFSDSFLGAAGGWNGCGCTRSEPTSDTFRLDPHSYEAGEPKHYGDADVLNLLRGVGVAGICTESFHPGVRDPIDEDNQGFDEFRGGI